MGKSTMNKAFELALSQYGIMEFPGKYHNPEVIKYFEGYGVYDDETSWCAAFMGWCMKNADMPYVKSLVARDWEKWGVKTEEPNIGDLAIFWRGDPKGWQGHVSFFVRKENSLIWVLGGNQSNKVCIDAYNSRQLICYRKYEPNS